jgi:hypothetical protein
MKERVLKVIYISRHGGIWWEDWSKTPESMHVKAVLGSAHVPAPFLDCVPARIVCRELCRLNPGYAVFTAEGGGVK